MSMATSVHESSVRGGEARLCVLPEPRLGAPLATRVTVFVYGLIAYALFFGVFVYAVGFVGNIWTPTSLDRLRSASSPSWPVALAIDLGLLLAFAVPHSVMARPWFKAWWTRVIPEAAERSTYVLISSVGMIAMFALWQPIGGVVWSIENPVARGAVFGLFVVGWLLVLVASFLINHFDLFGLRQVWLFVNNRPYTHLPFKTPWLYRFVRHPLYVGWMIFFWAAPTMTAAHLVFAIVTTVYMLMAIRWEERDLADLHGERYVEYRRRVPKLIPSASARGQDGGANS